MLTVFLLITIFLYLKQTLVFAGAGFSGLLIFVAMVISYVTLFLVKRRIRNFIQQLFKTKGAK